MYTQVYQQHIPVTQQHSFINFPSNQAFIGKTLQKNYSTSTLHKAPLPPKLIKTGKSPLLDPSVPIIPIGQLNLITSQNTNNQQTNGKQDNKSYITYNQQYQQNGGIHFQRQNDLENVQLGQSVINSQLDSQAFPTSPYIITASGIQILPISMQRGISQKGIVASQSINTPLYTARLNNSPISKIDLKGTQQLNNGNQQITQIPPQGQSNQINQNIQQYPQGQQEKLKRSSSEYIPRQPPNSDEFKQFQIFLNKVTIDPNDYFTLKPNTSNKNSKENNQESQTPQLNNFNTMNLDLKFTNMIEGGGSPFTLNRQSQQPAFQPISQQQQQLQSKENNQRFFSTLIPCSQDKLDQKIDDQENNQGSQTEEVKMRKPPIKTSVVCQKIKDNDVVTLLEIEDYGIMQNQQNNSNNNYQNEIQREAKQTASVQNLDNNASEIQKYESFGKQNFDNNGVQKYNNIGNQYYYSNPQQNYSSNYNSNRSNQDSLLAPYVQQNNPQFNQINLLSSIDSNVTGNEQSPFCSSFIRQSDLIRRRTNSVDDPQLLFNQTNINNLFSNPNSTKNAKTGSNPITIVETLPVTNYNSQGKNSIPIQAQRPSESIQELNEEYSESIVLDKINNQNKPNQSEQTNGRGQKRNEEKMSRIQRPVDNKDEIVQNTKNTDRIETIPSNSNYNQNDKNYYLQKANEILSQLGKNQTYHSDNINSTNTNNPSNPASLLSNQVPQQIHQVNPVYPITSITPISSNNSNSINLSSNIQNSGIAFQLLPKQQPIIKAVEPAQTITERRKNNIDQIVQNCISRTQNLLEKLKSKQQRKQGQQNQKNLNNVPQQLENSGKSKRHEEIRQSRQKVDQLVNEALYRSQQVVQRHVQSKMRTNSPPFFGYDRDGNQVGQNQLAFDNRNINEQNYSPQQRVVTDYAIYNRNQGSEGSNDMQKENNTFGYFSHGTQDRNSFSPNINHQFQANYDQNIEDQLEQHNYQIRISPVGSNEKSPITDYYDAHLISESKGNNSISFDIQAGNSGKSNQFTSQDNLSPFKQKIQGFGSSQQSLASPVRENQLPINKEGVEALNDIIFDGIVDVNGRKQGYGVLKSKTNFCIIYEGEWKDDLFHGQGVLYNQQPQDLEGSFSYNDFNNVHNYWKIYEGEFEMGQRNGSGTLMLTNLEKYSGKFQNNKINGEGVFYKNDNSKQPIVGQWINNILSKIL